MLACQGVLMPSFDHEGREVPHFWDAQDDDEGAYGSAFELEVSRLPGVVPFEIMALWNAQPPNRGATSTERRHRSVRAAVLVAICALVLVNTLTISGMLPPDLPLLPASLSASSLTAHAAAYNWMTLRKRPLRLPTLAKGAACPVSPQSELIIQSQVVKGIGDATIFVSSRNADARGVQQAVRSRFFHFAAEFRGVLVTWYLQLPDAQPVYIRGAQLNGPHVLRFDGGIEQPNFGRNLLGGATLPQLLIDSAPDHGTPVAAWTAITRIPASGCYAYQVDTPTRSVVLVFAAVVEA